MIRRAAVVAAFTAVMLAGGLIAKAHSLEEARAEAFEQAIVLASSAREAEMRTTYLTGAIDIAEAETAERAAVLDVRPAFLAELSALGAALAAAGGKIDTAAHRAAAVSAQQMVLEERRRPETVAAATATIHALTAKLGEEVSTWEAAQRVITRTPAGSSAGGGGYERVRAALDRVGGAGVGLYESSSCAGGSAPACANSNGYIKYRADVATWSSDRLHWAMAHELAHIYQFQVWGTLTSSGTYQSLFGGDPEFLANCMAVVRGFPGSVGCDSDQQAWASAIWVGAVR